MRLYIGTYTEPLPHVAGRGAGVYTYELDLARGVATQLALTTAVQNPTYLALNQEGTRLYAVQETELGRAALVALAINAEGVAKVLNSRPATGSYPCHLTFDHNERHVVIANYGGGSVNVFPILADGSLGALRDSVQHVGHSVNPARQEGPHAHCVTLDGEGHHLFVADLGLDQVKIYRLENGRLTAGEPAYAAVRPGAGPRHVAVHPNRRFVYVVNELGGTVSGFGYENGALTPLQTLSTLPADWAEEPSCAAIRFGPRGRFLYVSNRGHDSIAIFACDPESGLLTAQGHEPTRGATPRDFAFTPDGRHLLAANQDSDTVVCFRVDEASGQLHATGLVIEAPNPVALVMSDRRPGR